MILSAHCIHASKRWQHGRQCCLALYKHKHLLQHPDLVTSLVPASGIAEGQALLFLRVCTLQIELQHKEELVCMAMQSNLVAVGSRSHVSLLDPRSPKAKVSYLQSIDYGQVRSAPWQSLYCLEVACIDSCSCEHSCICIAVSATSEQDVHAAYGCTALQLPCPMM